MIVLDYCDPSQGGSASLSQTSVQEARGNMGTPFCRSIATALIEQDFMAILVQLNGELPL
jgi:hypothetical protein